MSSNHFQNNRVVHRNATSAVQIGIDTQSSIKTTNDKLDLALTQQTAVNTKLDSFSGAINNASIGDSSVKLQTYVYGHDASAGLARALKVDATGRLECNVSDIELHTGDISLSVDGLEGLIGTTNSKLQSDLDFAGQPNSIGDASNMKRVMNYGHDSAAGQQRPLKIDADGHLQVDCLSSALPSGGATEAKQDDGITHLATIAGDTTSLDSKVTLCNTGSVIIAASALPSGAATESTLASLLSSSQIISEDFTACDTGAVVVSTSALPSGAATAAHQATQNTALSEIEGAVENLELTVGTNAATAPTRSLQIGGKYQDGTFRDIKVDNIGKVIVDTPTGSDLDGRLATIGTNTAGLAGCVTGTELQVDVVSMPTTAVTLAGGATEAKQDVIETTLNAIQSAVEGTLATTSAATLQTGSATIGKLAANSGIDIGDVDVTSLPLTFNSGNKDATCQRVVIATDDVNLSAIKAAVEIIDNAITGNEMQCDIVASLPAGVNAIGKLSANDGVDIGDVDVTSISAGTNRIGKVVLMGNEAADGSGTERHALLDSAGHLQVDVLSAPTTAVTNTTLTNLDNCIDTNELQVDIVASLPAGTNAIGKLSANSGVDIGDVDVTSLPLTFNSGNKDGTCQRVVVATDDVNMSAIKSSLDSLDNAVDGNYLNVNQNIAGTDVDSNSGNKSAATQRVVVATDDVNLSAIKSSLTTIEGTVGLSKVNVNLSSDAVGLSTSALQGTLNTKIDTIDGVLDNSLLKQTLATTSEVKEFLSAATVNAGAQSAEFDTENYERARFFGESTASVGTDIILMGSNVSGGTFYVLGENLRSETISGVHYVYGPAMENLPRYIKILNKSGSTNYIFTKLYFQGSGGRLGV